MHLVRLIIILSKKFDYFSSVHNILLIRSYLGNCQQYVSINGINSSILNLTSDVPRGSSLGPLLFLIYISDFRICLTECSGGHFADDTFFMYHSRKPIIIETTINTELKLVNNWLNLKKLSLNTGKIEVIFFHSSCHAFDYSKISIKFRRKKITCVEHIKYFGIYIDKFLWCGYHVQYFCTKLSMVCYQSLDLTLPLKHF